jgi:dolichol-phosphate mannosyltransferase
MISNPVKNPTAERASASINQQVKSIVADPAWVTEPKKTISIIIPVFNEELVMRFLFDRLVEVMNRLEERYTVRLIFIDDGSRDNSWKVIRELSEKDPRFSGLRLSRNFGHQAALSCGYEFAAGDAVISMDADLQDPPEIIHELVRRWEEGDHVVMAVRKKREGESRFKLWTAQVFYRIMSVISETETPKETGDFRLMDRIVVDALKNITESHRYVRGLVGWLGFRRGVVEYDRSSRHSGTTKYSFLKMLRLATDAIVSFSFVPLRVAYLIALLLMAPFLLYLLYNVILYFFFNTAMVPGWPSLILATILFGTFNLLMLGILGEYIGRIYTEVKRRPIFLVEECCGQDVAGRTGRK